MPLTSATQPPIPNPMVISPYMVTEYSIPENLTVEVNFDSECSDPDCDDEHYHDDEMPELPSVVSTILGQKWSVLTAGKMPLAKVDSYIFNVNTLLQWGFMPCKFKQANNVGCNNKFCSIACYLYKNSYNYQSTVTNFFFENIRYKFQLHAYAADFTMAQPGAGLCSHDANVNSFAFATHEPCGYKIEHTVLKAWQNNYGNKSCPVCHLSQTFKCFLCEKNKTEEYKHLSIDGLGRFCCNACASSINKYPICIGCNTYIYGHSSLNDKCIKCQPEAIHNYEWKPAPVFHGNDSFPHFGIELEVEMKKGLEPFSKVVASRFQAEAGDFTYLKYDASIGNGFEIVTHPATLHYWTHEADKFWNSVKKLAVTCESWTVDNCGIHVHIGNDYFLGITHRARFLWFITHNKLFSAFIAERYQAKQAPFLAINKLEDAIQVASFNIKIDRHTAVNFQPELPTVEVRIFKGNMKKQRILKNIEFVDAVRDFTSDENCDNTVTSFIKHVKEHGTWPNLEAFISKYKKET